MISEDLKKWVLSRVTELVPIEVYKQLQEDHIRVIVREEIARYLSRFMLVVAPNPNEPL